MKNLTGIMRGEKYLFIIKLHFFFSEDKYITLIITPTFTSKNYELFNLNHRTSLHTKMLSSRLDSGDFNN